MASLNTDQRNESRVNTEPDAASIIAGQPSAELHVDDNPPPAGDIEYPTGAKVWLAIAAMYTAIFLNGLVSLFLTCTAWPSLTQKGSDNRGCCSPKPNRSLWNRARYRLVLCSLVRRVVRMCHESSLTGFSGLMASAFIPL